MRRSCGSFGHAGDTAIGHMNSRWSESAAMSNHAGNEERAEPRDSFRLLAVVRAKTIKTSIPELPVTVFRGGHSSNQHRRRPA